MTLKKLAENKQAVLKTISGLAAELTRLEAAKSPAEFQRLFATSPVAKTVAALLRITAPGPVGGASILPKTAIKQNKSRKKIALLVVVQGVTDERTAQKIADQLFDLDNSIDVGDVSVKDGNAMIPVSEVADFEAFRQKIRFADIVSADPAKKRIIIKLRKP